MVSSKTKLKNLFVGTSLERYAKYFYYGFDPSWKDLEIGSFCKGLWRNDETIKSLNFIQRLYDKNKAEFIFLNKNRPDVNILLMKQEKISKLAIVIAGGGYCSVATAVEGVSIGQHLYEKGFNVAILTYSIYKDAIGDKSIEDLICAVKYLNEHKKELKIDMDNYLVGGCSAGGHLAARLGTNNSGYLINNLPKPGLIYLAYPVIDMGKYAHVGSRDCVLGTNPTDEDIDKVSIQKHVDKTYPPVFLWQCQRDNVVDIHNSILMNEALNKANIKHIYETFDSDAHGWGIGTNTLADGWVDRMLTFYKKVI